LRLLSASTIGDDDGTGWEGEWGRGGEYDGECLLDNDRNDDEYNNNDKTMTQRMERGRAGQWTTGGIRLRWLQCCQRAIHQRHGAEDIDYWPQRHCRH
jgi:hypothetical protein